jgi:hypothetical protein
MTSQPKSSKIEFKSVTICVNKSIVKYHVRILWKVKGIPTRDFRFQVFVWISVHWAPEYSIGTVLNFSKIRGVRDWMFITGVNNTGDKLFTNFQWSPVSLTPVNNNQSPGPLIRVCKTTSLNECQMGRAVRVSVSTISILIKMFSRAYRRWQRQRWLIRQCSRDI